MRNAMKHTTITPQKPTKIHGIKHIFAAINYSAEGVLRLWKETAFRHEILLFLVIVAVLIKLGATPLHYMVAFTLFLLLASVEALNTAIECIVDHVSPEWSEFAKDAKDLGSFAVLCMIIANSAFLGYVVFMAWQQRALI